MSTDCCPKCGADIWRLKENGVVQVDSCTDCIWEVKR
jgi:predicted RNA-binding Zn-ribbon protein involved in translation (DUF1610 family)